jgi:molecular chaperone DnaK (HSP70)
MIAIDFGTSRTKLSYFDADRGAARLMGLSRRDDPFMSSLFYLGPDGRRLLGDDVEQMLEVDPGGVVDRLKRSLRRPTVRRNRQKVSPTVLLTLLLADLRTRAGEELPTLAGVVPKELTLTVPCQYGPPEEEILRQAAAAAGFEQVALMSEPEAAARAWEREVGGSEDAVVVLDCGGGRALLHGSGRGHIGPLSVLSRFSFASPRTPAFRAQSFG